MYFLCTFHGILLIVQLCEVKPGAVFKRRRVAFQTPPGDFFPISNRASVLNYKFTTLSSAVNERPSVTNDTKRMGIKRRKVKNKTRRVVHLEKTVITFSKLAEIEGSLTRNQNLKTTIERGVRFIGALNTKLADPMCSSAAKCESVSSSLKIDALQDGVDFLQGSMKKLESQTFFDQLQSEIFTFHSVPRNDREIQDFQIRIHERIKAFISFNELTLVKPGDEERIPPGSGSLDLTESESVHINVLSSSAPMIRY